MLKRFQTHLQDLQDHLPSARVVISTDTTGPGGPAVLEQVRETVPSADVHAYDWQDVRAEYPAVDQCPGPAQGWQWHAEGLLMAVKHAKLSAKFAKEARVWVIEDDVFFCGDLSSFISTYQNDSS